ncbi:MAG: GC-type dockerin domain-anchored protein [Phycisphaerales bacterium]
MNMRAMFVGSGRRKSGGWFGALSAAVVGVCLIAGEASAQTTTDGNSVFTMPDTQTTGGTVRTGTTGGTASAFTAGGNTTDQLFQQWWWYRVSGVNVREFALSGRTSSVASGNTHTLTFTEPEGFNATLVYKITDGPDSPATANVSSTLTVTNTTGSSMTIDVFVYLDYDLQGSGGDVAVLVEPGRMQITDQASGFNGQFMAVDALQHQVATFATVRGLLTDADIDDLNGTGLPFASGDFTGAFQWRATIGAGQSRAFRSAFSLNTPAVPEPPACRADFNGMGGVTLQDVFDYLGAWFVSSPMAEIDGFAGITLQDLFDYLGLWFTGC